ncbi:4Fe-4S dicluster domain-containing protein [Chloroflexota bacterium]
MSHSLYRQGTYENLSDDFVILTSTGKEFKDIAARINRFREIGFKHGMINIPGVQSPASPRNLVFDSREKVCGVLKDLAKAELELSVLVSGLRDQVTDCCHSADLTPHTVHQSLGFWGRLEKLPPNPILEITTMCGHGRVAPNLVWEMADKVIGQSLDVKATARHMGKLCLCNIFNELRATRLLKKLVADIQAGIIAMPVSSDKSDIGTGKDFGITIDGAKCIQCLECLPYCPLEAIVASPDGSEVFIDAQRCTECGLCHRDKVCPVDAIVAMDLTWPRSLRGKFQPQYGPYRSATTLAKTVKPVSYSTEPFSFRRHELPSEHTSDADGLLRQGEAAILVELGRPYLGTTFRDVQKVVQALLPMGLNLRLQYPNADERSSLADIAADTAAGTLMPEVLEERTGWVVLKLVTKEKNVPETIRCLKQVAADIDTVFALGVLSHVSRDGSTIAERAAIESGVTPAVNCKTNIGLRLMNHR